MVSDNTTGIVLSLNTIDWIALSAIATFVLASAAFVTLFLTRRGLKQERREDRRMEILRWATDIAIFALERRPEARHPLISDGAYLRAREDELFTILEPFRVKSVYIEEIASKMEPNLQKTTGSLILSLRGQIRLFHKYKKGKVIRSEELVGNIRRNFGGIHQRAVKVIREAAKVNTRDL